MKMFQRFGPLVVCALLTGCIPPSSSSVAPPPPTAQGQSDVMRAGDKVTIRLAGVPDEGYIIEKEIPASGDMALPLLTRPFHFVGRSCPDVAAEIAAAYRDEKIYTNPNVTILPQERYVSVGGEVRSPNRVLYSSDLTLLGALNSCGGFTEYAKKQAVRITRGKDTFQVDCIEAQKGTGVDPVIYPGDQIYVPRTIL